MVDNINDDNIEEVTDADDVDMGLPDDLMDEGSDLDDLMIGEDKPTGDRKPVTDFAQGVGASLVGMKLSKPAIGEDITRNFPVTSSLFDSSVNIASDLERLRTDVYKDISPAVNQLKQAGRRVMPRVKAVLPESVYNKVYEKLKPAEDVGSAKEDVEGERTQTITQHLSAIFEAQHAQDREDDVRERADDFIQSKIERSEHKDKAHLLSGIKAHLALQTNFSQTALKGYLMKSLELKYRHLFVAQDTLASQKMMVDILDTRLKSIAKNTALPDVQKMQGLEWIKEQQMERLMGKGIQTVGDWSQNFRTQLMSNITKFAKEKGGMAKDAISDAASMIDQYEDMQALEDEMGFGEKESGAKGAGKFLGSMAATKLGRVVIQKASKAMGQYGTDAENLSGNIQRNIAFAINDKIQNMEEGGFKSFLQDIVPTIDSERGEVQKVLKKQAFEEVPWDVLSRRTLVEIIPALLSKQLAQLENIATGRTDSQELIYDVNKEDFVRAEQFQEDLRKKYFGDQETRTSEVSEGVGKLLGAYSMHGGNEADFYEQMDDVVKFINNSAKHLKRISPGKIKKLAAGEEIDDKTYEDLVFKDVEDKGALLQLLNQAFHDDTGKANVDVMTEMDKLTKEIGVARDERLLKEIQLTGGLGTTRLHKDLFDREGRLDHSKVREAYADVDKEQLELEAQRVAQLSRESYEKAEKGRFMKASTLGAEELTDREQELTDFKKQKKAEKDEAWNQRDVEERRENIFDRMAKRLDDIATKFDPKNESKEALAEKLADEINDLKEKTKSDEASKVIKDFAHISGPGVYVQAAEQEAHIPMDTDAYWRNLEQAMSTGVDRSQFREEVTQRFDDVEIDMDPQAQLYEDVTEIRNILEDTLPGMSTGLIDPEMLKEMGTKGRGLFGRVKDAGLSFGGSVMSRSQQMMGTYIDMASNLMKGAGNLGGSLLGAGGTLVGAGAGAAGTVLTGGAKMYGGLMRGIGNKLSGMGKPKMPSFDISAQLKGIDVTDLFVGRSMTPAITAEQLKEGLKDAKGNIINKISDIKDPPLFDINTGEMVLSIEDFMKGLFTAEGIPLMSMAEVKEKGKGLLSRAAGAAGKGISGAAKLGSKFLGGGFDMYQQLFDLSMKGISGTGKFIGKMLGLGEGGIGLGGKKALKEMVGDKLDMIYNLLDERMRKPVAGDADFDGDREGSYADYMQEQEEEKAAKASGTDLRLGQRLKATRQRFAGGPMASAGALMGGGGLLSLGGRPQDQDAEDMFAEKEEDDDVGMIDMALGSLGATAVGGLATKFKGKIAEKWAARKAKKAAAKGAAKGGLTAMKILKGSKLGKLAMLGTGALGLGKMGMDKLGGLFGKEAAEVGAEKVGKEAAETVATKGAAKAATTAATTVAAKEATKTVAKKSVAKGAAKVAGKAVPGLGLLMGLGFGFKRAMDGDWKGAGMELASGAASTFLPPGIGLATTLAIETALVARDITDASKTPDGRLQKARFEAYGMKSPGMKEEENLVSLEEWQMMIMKTGKDITGPILGEWAKRFGFGDPGDKEAASFFYSWFKNRFSPALTIFRSLLKTKFDIEEMEQINSLTDDQVEEFVREYSEYIAKEIKLDKMIVPTKSAYEQYTKKDTKKKGWWASFKEKVFGSEKDQVPEASIATKDVTAANEALAGKARSKTTAKIMPTAENMLKGKLGVLSERYESRGSSAAVGYDRVGGTSYGKYQIASATKRGGKSTFDEFLEWVEEQPGGAEIAERLKAAGDANTGGKVGRVPNEWKKLVMEGKMGEFEHKFIQETHYDPAFNKLRNQDFKDRIEASKPLKDVLWSTAVQHGPRGAADIFNKAYNKDLSDSEIVKRIYNIRSTKFRSSTAAVRRSVWNRFENEQAQVMAMMQKNEELKRQISTSTITPGSPEMVAQLPKSGAKAGTPETGYTQPASVEAKTVSGKPDISDQEVAQAVASKDGKIDVNVNPDEKQHELINELIAETKRNNQTMSELNKHMQASLGNDGVFSAMEKHMKKTADKDPVVNIDARTLATATPSNVGEAPNYQGVNVSKRRVS